MIRIFTGVPSSSTNPLPGTGAVDAADDSFGAGGVDWAAAGDDCEAAGEVAGAWFCERANAARSTTRMHTKSKASDRFISLLVPEPWTAGTIVPLHHARNSKGEPVIAVTGMCAVTEVRLTSEPGGDLRRLLWAQKIRERWPVSYTHLTLPTNREV